MPGTIGFYGRHKIKMHNPVRNSDEDILNEGYVDLFYANYCVNIY